MAGGILFIVSIGVAVAAVPGTGATGDTGLPPDTDPPAETGDTGPNDTGVDLDLDQEGVTPRDGDCDDADPNESPNLPEVCFDELDNDCDGLYDEGETEACDDAARLASLRGGGGCTGESGIAGT